MDSSRQRIEHVGLNGNTCRFFRSSKFAEFPPLDIIVNEGRLYWVGVVGNNQSSEALFGLDLTADGGLAKESGLVHYFAATNVTRVTMRVTS